MSPLFQRASAVAIGSVTNVFLDRPWRSKTVRVALLIVVVGMGFWLKRTFQGTPESNGIHFDHPVPWYVRLAVSYIGGFLLGWTFRRFLKLTFLIVVAIVALLSVVKFAGCDASALRAKVEHEAETAKEKAAHERDYLKGLLPSSLAAGVGVFWGFWRRSRGLDQAPPPNMAGGNPPFPKTP